MTDTERSDAVRVGGKCSGTASGPVRFPQCVLRSRQSGTGPFSALGHERSVLCSNCLFDKTQRIGGRN